jgi:hypothetical protein
MVSSKYAGLTIHVIDFFKKVFISCIDEDRISSSSNSNLNSNDYMPTVTLSKLSKKYAQIYDKVKRNDKITSEYLNNLVVANLIEKLETESPNRKSGGRQAEYRLLVGDDIVQDIKDDRCLRNIIDDAIYIKSHFPDYTKENDDIPRTYPEALRVQFYIFRP